MVGWVLNCIEQFLGPYFTSKAENGVQFTCGIYLQPYKIEISI
jgi:hypothetical protein